MLDAKGSVGSGIVVNVSATFAISIRSCYSLIMSVLGLKPYIEISKYVSWFRMGDTTQMLIQYIPKRLSDLFKIRPECGP